jgi:hypothetical protein
VNLKQAAWFSAVPWATMAISGYLAGTASDFLINAGYPTTFVRKFMQVTLSASSSIRLYLHKLRCIYMIVRNFLFSF